eukprot:883695-Alexandrium_andersonii.AAC.1
MDLGAVLTRGDAKREGGKPAAGCRRPVLRHQPAARVRLREEPRGVPSGEEEPLKGCRLPWPARAAREVVHESGDPDQESAPCRVQDGV